MLPFQKPLTLHEIAVSTYPIGIQCDRCIRRTLLTAEAVGARRDDPRRLGEAGHQCKCGSSSFSVQLFHRDAEVKAWIRNH